MHRRWLWFPPVFFLFFLSFPFFLVMASGPKQKGRSAARAFAAALGRGLAEGTQPRKTPGTGGRSRWTHGKKPQKPLQTDVVTDQDKKPRRKAANHRTGARGGGEISRAAGRGYVSDDGRNPLPNRNPPLRQTPAPRTARPRRLPIRNRTKNQRCARTFESVREKIERATDRDRVGPKIDAASPGAAP